MIVEWVERLSRPSTATNGLPTCPYAKRALEDGKVLIVRGGDVANVIARWADRYDVAVVLVGRTSIEPEAARELADRLTLRHKR